MNKKTQIIVGFVVVAALSFYGGMKYNQSKAVTNTRTGTGQFAGGQRGTRGGGTGAVMGEILSKDDTSITVKMRSGGSSIVFLTANTPVMKSVAGANTDLAVGQQVMVFGTPNSDGSVTAQSIQIRPATTTSVTNQ